MLKQLAQWYSRHSTVKLFKNINAKKRWQHLLPGIAFSSYSLCYVALNVMSVHILLFCVLLSITSVTNVSPRYHTKHFSIFSLGLHVCLFPCNFSIFSWWTSFPLYSRAQREWIILFLFWVTSSLCEVTSLRIFSLHFLSGQSSPHSSKTLHLLCFNTISF